MSTPNYESMEYKHHKKQVKLVNDFFAGVDYAKEYLSRYPREDKDKFKDRQSRASLSNYVKQTTETVANIVFRKDIDQENIKNARLKTWLKKYV